MDNGNNRDRNDNNKENTSANFSVVGEMLTISSTLAAGVLVGYFSGNFLDKKLGTSPWLTILMLFLGVAAGFKSVYTIMFSKKGGK